MLGADGGVQKIKSVIRALVRVERDVIDIDQYNEDTNPTEILKFIASQVASYQDLDEKPEHVAKIMKRLKRMVRLASCNDAIFQLTLDSSFNVLNIHCTTGKERYILSLLCEGIRG